MTAAPLTSAEVPLLSDQAYIAIRDLIVSLDMQPGSVVSESELMSRLGLGRTPVREALRTLAHENLIDVYPRRGMFVAPVDARDLAAISEARSLLEPAAARLASTRLTDADRLELDGLLAELEMSAHQPQGRTLMDLDRRIHHFVYRCSGNRFIESALDEYYAHALRIWFLALDRLEHLEDAVLEHRAILEAVRAGDPDRAAEVMSAHINGFESSIRLAL